jgi:predicted lipid carrier protein YhbT
VIKPKEVFQRLETQGVLMIKHIFTCTGPSVWQMTPKLIVFGERQLPKQLRCELLQRLLRGFFAQRAKLGELDFLIGKSIRIEVSSTEARTTDKTQSIAKKPAEQAFSQMHVIDSALVSGKTIICSYVVSCSASRQLFVSDSGDCDVLFRADLSSLISMICQQADADTLFFRRKLLVSGDTETGLHLKNYLDQISVDTKLPNWLHLAAVELLVYAP